MTDKIEDLLDERNHTHGDFTDHARATQRLKVIIRSERVLRSKRGQKDLSEMELEALDMIVHKIGRILAGNASYPDHWVDIAGYAQLPLRFSMDKNLSASSIPTSTKESVLKSPHEEEDPEPFKNLFPLDSSRSDL